MIAENRIDKPTFSRLFERYVRFWLGNGGVRALMSRSEADDGPNESGWVSLVRLLDQYFGPDSVVQPRANRETPPTAPVSDD
jgi:hypothetical protein